MSQVLGPISDQLFAHFSPAWEAAHCVLASAGSRAEAPRAQQQQCGHRVPLAQGGEDKGLCGRSVVPVHFEMHGNGLGMGLKELTGQIHM